MNREFHNFSWKAKYLPQSSKKFKKGKIPYSFFPSLGIINVSRVEKKAVK
jgi:hypothetical protein